MSSITVLLVDDHLVVRSGLRALLGTQPDLEVIGEAASGEEALERVREHSPGVVVMDLAMGSGMDGIEAIRKIRERNSGQAVESTPPIKPSRKIISCEFRNKIRLERWPSVRNPVIGRLPSNAISSPG